MLQVIQDIQTELAGLQTAVTALEGKTIGADDTAALDGIKTTVAVLTDQINKIVSPA